MKIFISWSGPRSRALAEALHEWLPCVIQSIEPFISTQMDKGIDWFGELTTELGGTSFGLLCVTPENKDAPWLHWEAGALFKSIGGKAHVVPILLGFHDISELGPPLGSLNAMLANRAHIRSLLDTVNTAIEQGGGKALSKQALDDAFDVWWPRLEERLTDVGSMNSNAVQPMLRPPQELFAEIVTMLRRMSDEVTSLDRTVRAQDRWPREGLTMSAQAGMSLGGEGTLVAGPGSVSLDDLNRVLGAIRVGRSVVRAMPHKPGAVMLTSESPVTDPSKRMYRKMTEDLGVQVAGWIVPSGSERQLKLDDERQAEMAALADAEAAELMNGEEEA